MGMTTNITVFRDVRPCSLADEVSFVKIHAVPMPFPCHAVPLRV